MKNIKSFNEFYGDLVWDPKRKPVDPRLMPSEDNRKLYSKAVREEINKVLVDVYQLGDNDIMKIQDVIWDSNFENWKDVFDDCLVNWDTPENCAQKAVTKMKSFFNLT